MRDDPILRRFLRRSQPVKDKLKAIYLFGSRARGHERPDSDYDLLLVVSAHFSRVDKDRLYDAVMDVLLETGRLISLKIFREEEFQRLRRLGTPFIENISKEGIKIG